MTRRLRICVLAPASNVHTRRWLEALKGLGHDVLLIPQDGGDPVIEVEIFDAYREMGFVRRLPKLRALAAEFLLFAKVRQFGPDLVHLHWLNVSRGTLRLVRRLQPLVASAWGRDVIWDGPGGEPAGHIHLKRQILAHAVRVTATSKFLAEWTVPFLERGRQVAIVPFGVDCERFRPSSDARQPGSPVIGFLKHYTPKYGPDVFLEAIGILFREGLDFRARMYGTHDPSPYQRLAESLGIQSRVSISGAIPHYQVPEILQGFDVYAMPSVHDSETFGVAALEASACGVPVVASRVGGVPEVIEHERTGLLVQPGHPADLAAALRRLLLDAQERGSMGAAGAQFVRQRYSWKRSVELMQQVYDEVLGGARS